MASCGSNRRRRGRRLRPDQGKPVPEPRSTGMPGIDAQHDFLRARRRATIARLTARLRGEPDDVGVVLPYEEVVEGLGFLGERSVGLQVVPLDAIVGTVD